MHEMICAWAGLAVGLVFPLPRPQKGLYQMVQPEPASGKRLNAESSISDPVSLNFPLAFKIKQIQKCKRKPFGSNK